MTRNEIQKVRDALAYYGHSSVSRPATTEALAILDAALAAPEQEPVVYWGGDRSVIPADEVSYIPNWTDYYPTPLYRHPAPQSQPVARVTGYYGGNCVIEPLDGWTVFPTGMAVYSAPVAAQSEQEPVAWAFWCPGEQEVSYYKDEPPDDSARSGCKKRPLYTAPPSREWQGLTDEEIKQVLRHPTWSLFDYAKAIESALRAKNTGEQA